MFRKLVTAGVLAGAVAGLFAAYLQFVLVVPMVLEGELFETGMRLHFAAGAAPESVRGAPGLGNDWGRHLMTVAFDLVTYVGFGLILAALILLARRDDGIDARRGLIWGLAGFVAVQLAPAVGLPPELPGSIGAEVGARQVWWVSTILASAAGLWLIAFGRGALPFLGAVLLALPHIVGAPHLDRYYGVSPPELAAEFATVSLGAAAAGWAVLGAALGWFLSRSQA